MQSIWHDTVQMPRFPALSNDQRADAALIGGGLAGLLCAYMLEKRGIHTIVLEADRIGSGQSGNTTAKITSQHNLIYHRLIEDWGMTKAKLYADANQTAIKGYEQIIRELFIDCQYQQLPAYLYSCQSSDLLREEHDAARRLGIPAELTKRHELPFAARTLLRFDDQAQFHPLLFMKALARDLTIYENTRVLSVKGHIITTDKGTVNATSIIFACHYPFPIRPGYYFLRMHQERSYCIALKNAPRLNGMYLGVDPGHSFSLRSSQNTLILGGLSHRTGENSIGGEYADLRKCALQWWPKSTETAHWSAQDCMTLDGVPYIGRFSSTEPDWYVATGFGKWGMTNSMIAALLICDLIQETSNPWEVLFSPQRFTPRASASAFASEAHHAVRGLFRRLRSADLKALEALEPGHGGLVSIENEKMGVYREPTGQFHIVQPFCPHLGCQLEWNPEELTWDCPCHGSRFDYDGRLLDDPAQTNLFTLTRS